MSGGFVTKVSGMEGVLCVVPGDSGGSRSHQWGTGSAGTWSGRVLVFDIPAKGPNIVLSEELAGHQTSVTDIATEPAQGQVSGFPLPNPVSLGAFPLWQAADLGLSLDSTAKPLDHFGQIAALSQASATSSPVVKPDCPFTWHVIVHKHFSTLV